MSPAAPDAPAVALLDTGIDEGHPLLRACIIGAHTFIHGEGVYDNAGHGTQMAGLVIFGDTLDGALGSRATVRLDHHVESVKILSRGRDQRRPYGEVTTVAVSTAETAETESNRQRVFAMASPLVRAAMPEGVESREGTPGPSAA
ncbi:S8 family serine peptidase [Streptacidiphilus sp. PB12-B1b]|uniref:S8 family serine peptidase n=1 Tax=Streptacidiphilus sp. PB12-B1b TaxID=2705012 RepID=UPI0015F94ADF|nr:S8 family serine peptidase [Streptacidiphilus sp. PB12-B1b]QMU75038.1 S8 family serine peptidase [Streptacidiphilus sp. PB12-B1b]